MANPFIRRVVRDNLGPGFPWGFATFEDYKNVRVFVPIPFNLVYCFAKWAWAWLAWRATWMMLDSMPPEDKEFELDMMRRDNKMAREASAITGQPCFPHLCAYCAQALDRGPHS